MHRPETPPPDAVSGHVVDFVHLLRRIGFAIGSGEVLQTLAALRLIEIHDPAAVRQTLSCFFVRRPEERPLFDQAFHLFWTARRDLPGALEALLPSVKGRPPAPKPGALRLQQALRDPAGPARSAQRPKEEKEDILTYSAAEVLRTKDFAAFTEAEITAARAYLKGLRWSPSPRTTRRYAASVRGRKLDARRTLRHALRSRGEPMRLHTRGPRTKPRPLVVLCDISGSMERYARMLLHFMHTITGGQQRVESFVFGTRLTRITRSLKRRDVEIALDEVADTVHDWNGGTRIGEALRTFNYTWLRRVLRSGSVVLIISDGWDRGDPELLAREIERLSRSSHRLIWLNPLLGYEDYRPLTRGIQAVLPYTDEFLPVHNLQSLEQLAAVLARLSGRSAPVRRTGAGDS